MVNRMTDRADIEYALAYHEERINTLLVDKDFMTEDERLIAEGQIAESRDQRAWLKENKDRYMYHHEAIHVFRKLMLDFAIRPTTRTVVGFNPDTHIMLKLTTDSKFVLERFDKALRTLGSGHTKPYAWRDSLECIFALDKTVLKEIRDLKKPRKRRMRSKK